MRKTVNEIIQETDIKKGVVESFRKKLQIMNIIENNTSLDSNQVDLLKEIVKAKKADETWDNIMYRYIYNEYWNILKTNFEWQPEIIIKNLIWNISNNYYTVEHMIIRPVNEKLSFQIFECIIDNFSIQGKKYEPYMNSHGTDGNTIAYEISNLKKTYTYYVIGKLNHYTKKEDIHIFYNDSENFNIMKCRYISGGPCDQGIFQELNKALH